MVLKGRVAVWDIATGRRTAGADVGTEPTAQAAVDGDLGTVAIKDRRLKVFTLTLAR